MMYLEDGCYIFYITRLMSPYLDTRIFFHLNKTRLVNKVREECNTDS